MIIRAITAEQTLPLRQAVLWPDHPLSANRLEGDDSALHFGGFAGDRLVCTASLFSDKDQIRLRKFATLRDEQGQGRGTAMIHHLLAVARAQQAQVFWFDARESALPFYARFGFETSGDPFFKRDIPYRRMSLRLAP
ncbi:putative acetyltransferase [Tritonibacter multivorans]|uniref:Putative acetyltransferase n=1 Tax=Tritonibacter multivorans TaxID=928856 RepID=A0A0P1GJU5_9RHOB|nr:GNAT family N-acetyltransferase [Tritonibacter multivorans]MDA7419577.1 GNAT family N-acetyltransferase [Tritonibacter multivorans]CUH75747.1 putative acetyltransferase [Tritonibacter multivorans]SFC61723.1 Predicted N-acyltransferase, GNAT family [Tritonibacter multivorans]